jgi:hypothetical protein
MSHAKSSRVIGQFLDIAIVPSFELEKERHAQIIYSEAIP